jgi:hypothetical protein
VILWKMEPKERALTGYMPNNTLSLATSVCGMNILAIPDVFIKEGVDVIDMELIEGRKPVSLKERQSVPDVVFWSWGIPIISSKSRDNIESIDQNPSEFWKCRFLSNPGEEFFMHLPSKAFDLIDVEKSTFKSVLPTNPPLRLFLEAAVVKNYPTASWVL